MGAKATSQDQQRPQKWINTDFQHRVFAATATRLWCHHEAWDSRVIFFFDLFFSPQIKISEAECWPMPIWHRFILPLLTPFLMVKKNNLEVTQNNCKNRFGCWNLTHVFIIQRRSFFWQKMRRWTLKWVRTACPKIGVFSYFPKYCFFFYILDVLVVS